MHTRFLAVGLLILTLSAACSREPETNVDEMEGIHLELIDLPPGFTIDLVTDQVPGARSLALSPNGVLYVGTRGVGKVYAVTDMEEAKAAPRVVTVASDLNVPNGVTWRGGSLYVAEISQILRFDDIDGRLDDPPPPVVVSEDFPTDALHGWKFIRFGPDERLYVPVGAPCNICVPEDPIYGAISRLDPTSGDREIFAQGIRNTVGFDWHPGTGELWFTDNGADMMGDDLPPDELNKAPEAGLDFGFPYCHGGDIPDPDLGEEASCEGTEPPAIRLGPHVAALGMRFYTGQLFPADLHGQIFIAEHGSWDRPIPIGYRVTQVRLEGNQAVEYSTFAEGWLQGNRAWGRPVDVEIAHDGSLLVSDDQSGAIYRIGYEGGQ